MAPTYAAGPGPSRPQSFGVRDGADERRWVFLRVLREYSAPTGYWPDTRMPIKESRCPASFPIARARNLIPRAYTGVQYDLLEKHIRNRFFNCFRVLFLPVAVRPLGLFRIPSVGM